jgi:multicomponent Na+:H+ antiporter subunit A
MVASVAGTGGEQGVGMPFDVIVVLLVLAPFVAAPVAIGLQRTIGSLSGWVLALVPIAIGWWMLPLIPRIAQGETVRTAVEWVPTLGLTLGFAIDGLSLTFAMLILGIGAIVLIYSAAHLRGHLHQGRYMAFMMLFMGSMLGLVLADDMVALFAFWELTSVSSFLLIGFDHTRQAARRAAIQALVVTAIGGLALLVAAVLFRITAGTWSLGTLGDQTASAVYPFVLVAILVAAFTKSAQVPFHFWLPNAMEAPTPVSAYLHSATMVQAGIYLLLRMNPTLGDTTAWATSLCIFGSVTFVWGAIGALRHTDLKWMLAHTTVASIGLSVLLIGIGTEGAIVAAIVYFIAHALYKATLFLVVGLIDKEAGVRDLTALGGLRERMAVTFIAALFAGVSMFGLPPAIGYFAKEVMYAGVLGGDWVNVVLAVVMVVGNAALGAIALALMIKPFMGPVVAMPKAPREGPFGMLLALAVLAAGGIVAGWQSTWLAVTIVSPAASAVSGSPIEAHLAFSLDPFDLALWLSVATWALAGVFYWQLDALRAAARRIQSAMGTSFDSAFDVAMFGLIRGAAIVTRALHHGRLELYLVVVFALLLLAVVVPQWTVGGVPAIPDVPALTFYEWGIVLLAAIGILAVVFARTRLFAIIALGVQGFAVAVIFMLFGAPDLSFTQFMVEVLSVVILALVMTKLNLDASDGRHGEDLIRDGGLALLCGAGITLLLVAVVRNPFDPRLNDFFEAASYPLAHGRNIVNVILVDFRGLDTLGEIAVVVGAGIAVLALLRKRPGRPKIEAVAEQVDNPTSPKPRRPRRAKPKTVTPPDRSPRPEGQPT